MATTQRDQRVDNPEPFEEQEPFLWDRHRYYTYASGVGSGKTAVGLMRAAVNVDHWNPGYMGAIVAPTSTMIKNAIFPLMSEFGIRDRWDYKGPQSEEPGFHTPNGSRVLILSADNERTIERLAGLNLAWFWVDEARDVPERAIQILIQRLRKGRYKNGFLTSTPRRNHLEDFAFKDIDKDDGYKWGEGSVYENDKRLTITGVTPDSNPYVDDEDIAAIREAHPSGILQQEVEGQFVDVGGGVFQRDMLSWIHPDEITTNQLRPIIAVDPAATVDAQRAESQDSDYWACAVVYAYPRKDKIYVTETARRRGMTLQEGCQWIGQIAKQVPQASVVAEANQAQRWLIDALKDHGVYAEPVTSTRNKESRILDLSIPLENRTIEFVDHNAETPDDVGTNPPYQELIGELLSFPEGSHDDMVDALHRAVDYAPVSLGTTILGSDPYSTNDES